MLRAGPSQEEIRRHNLGTLLRHVHLGGPMSRAELTHLMGLNRSTIMALTADLTAAGLVREELPRDTGKAGRPSLVVLPETHRVYVLAFDVGVDRLAAARIGLGGVILDRREAERRRGPFDLGQVVTTLAGFARQMLRGVRADAVCVGAAVAFCGAVRKSDGVVRIGPNVGAEEVPLGEELSKRLSLGLPVVVGNDANLGALAEHARGAGVGCRDLVYLHGDVGIGGGIVVNGQLLSGADGYGGEVGHMVLNPGGRPCGCGSRGCFEAEVGERALLEYAGRQGGAAGRDGIRAIVTAAELGDAAAKEALRRVGHWLGLGVANLVNVLNPEMVIFGGMLRDIYLGAAAQVRSTLNTTALRATREGLRLRTAALGDDATLMGAAELAFADVLADPLEALSRAAM
ncbi:sugar kinase [Thermobispora bispora]|uniref:ROK family protein n=1 Tax=Thermobispora bispora (strain ATCC 19993 / DSM 43833 / CBS 139.67 / JCM 10125 / KCTC 9307 / NBRC 14880 / R51) TaxID=469371 RepID=D6Y3A6_THEBD|nr:ROK family protein [Thermobispora bispora]ADG88981.1 ROK family protein [Thermobispora bispora DSM 43833]MBO2474663.1 ROK family protein [Actinomycetales bacterium]MDI9581593.1 ROK family protein [Thermobispora sp.]QSI48717.1 ROK family transcriptional regulator [Thermobispora bispora]